MGRWSIRGDSDSDIWFKACCLPPSWITTAAAGSSRNCTAAWVRWTTWQTSNRTNEDQGQRRKPSCAGETSRARPSESDRTQQVRALPPDRGPASSCERFDELDAGGGWL